MDEGSSAEFCYLCGLVELVSDAPDRARKACDMVRHADFVDDRRRDVYRVIVDVLATVDDPKWPDFQRHESWDRQISVAVGECIAASAKEGRGFSFSVHRFAKQVREAATRRSVDLAISDLGALAYDRAPAAEIMQAAEAVKNAAASVESGDVETTLADAIVEYLEHEVTPKVATGFDPLDRITGGGLPIGGLSVLAAPPSVGKSALALQACIGAMDRDDGLAVVWAMGEMTPEAFARRAICHWSTTRGGRTVSMSAAERRSDDARGTAIALQGMFGRRMTIVRPPLAIGRIEDAVVETHAKLLVIDYVQLVEMEAADRRAEIDGVVKRIRRLSLERDVAVVAISNIAKAVVSDTRIGAIGKESSELDFAADLLLLGVPDEDSDQNGVRLVRWACKKNRHGPCEDIVTRFDGSLQTFTDAAAVRDPALGDW